MQTKVGRVLKKTLKVAGWVIGSILVLLLLVIAAVQLPAVQQKITQKAISFLEDKIGTEVQLQKLYISFPKNIVMEGLYLEDQSQDTLLYVGELSIDTDLWALTRNEIQLNNINLENMLANVKRAEGDSAFNYSYIMEAFAGDSTAVPDTLEQKGWTFALETIALENIRANYNDYLTGNHADVTLGEFELEMDEFDLENLVFGVKDIALRNTAFNVRQTKEPEVTEEVAEETYDSSTLDFNFNAIVLENVKGRYTQEITGQNISLNIGETILNANVIDLQKQIIDLDRFSLNNSFIAYQQLQSERKPKDQAASSQAAQRSSSSQPPTRSKTEGVTSEKAWDIRLNELSLKDNNIQYYDFTKTHQKKSVDFDHLWINNLAIEAEDIKAHGSDIEMDLKTFSFLEKSGFSLKNFKGNLRIAEDTAIVNDLVLETGNSKFNFTANAGFKSFQNIGKTYPESVIKATIDKSHIGIRDLLYFSPTLLDSIPLELTPSQRISVDAFVNGRVNNLNIHHFTMNALGDTYLKTSGTIAGLPDADKLSVDIALDKFYTTSRDIATILPDTLLPDSIAIPNWINLNAKYKGTLKKGQFNTLLASSIGSVDAKGKINLDSTSSTRGFSGDLAVNEFDLGYLLMQPKTIGKLNLQASLNSEGLTKEEMNSAVKATIESFRYNDYEYKNLQLSGTVKNDVLKGWASIKDPNLEFALQGDYNFQNEVPKYDFTFDLKNIDMKALNLSPRPLKLRGILEVDMATADMRILNGKVGIRKVAVYNGDDLYAVDSLLFASIDQKGRSEIKIESDIMNGSFIGSINIFQMSAALREYFNSYYSLHDSVEQSYEEPQHFKFQLQLKKTELLTDILLPQLTSFVPGELKGEFDSKAKKLNIRLDIADIQYSNIGVKKFLFSTNSNADRLNYNIFVDRIMIDSTKIDGVEFNGTVSNDSIQTDLIVLDSLDVHKYVLAGTFYSKEKEFELRLDPNKIKLNYQEWAVPPTNYIRFGGPKVVAQNVELANGREKIIFESKPDPASPMTIGFRELNLEYLASMVAQEKPVSGLLEGDINIFPDTSMFKFTSALKITDLRFSELPWGNLVLNVEQNVKDRFDVDFSLIGKNNDIKINGYYTGGANATLDLRTNIARFDLAVIDPIVSSQIQNLKGTLTGDIFVKGKPSKPDIDGGINFKDTQFLSTFLNTNFTLKNERIRFIEEGLGFENFTLIDRDNNKATLNGVIATRDYTNYQFKLDLITNNFQLLNTTAKDNDMFYGRVGLNANARIRGNSTNPSVDVELGLTEGSNLTYIVPQSEASILEQQGIVTFKDKTFKGDKFMKEVQKELADSVKSKFVGINLTAKIELTDEESFTVIIDPTTNDQLTVKGNTTLTLDMDQTGDMQLSGRYEISEGTYNLSFYKFVKRQFSIEKGSTMTWSGDPLNAEMDIRAVFNVETAPIDLMINQASDDPNIMNQYKQRLPFQVYLLLAGQLLKPEISFRLDMPIDERNFMGGNVYAKLMDINTRESDLNKQVFALLILKRFISDNPFENQGSQGIAGSARSSVSKILTEQLNRLSENVRGVELSFDVKSYEDYQTGQAQGQTELELGLSKSLLNDRLVVKVSGNVDVEGENSNQEVTDYIGDLALEYMLTDDGRFRITGFRNSNYDMIDGELIETGAGLIYIKDYNTLRELFKANAKKNKK
ncbi:MAG TPA: translocation/assembly module TamB domain-containing protein [Chryseosolibacter sp.]